MIQYKYKISTVTDQNPLETYGLLSVNVSNSNVHIVGGVMDRGGTLTVPDNAPGELINDGYSEKVTEGESSAEMTFEAKDGYEISQIVLKTTAESALDSRDILYDIADGTNKIDADGDGTPDYDGGIYTHQFENVQGAATVEVYTRLKNFTLTTVSDTGSEIRHGGTYTWSEDSLTVYFAARDGYEITEIYAGETQTDAENTGNIIDSNDTNLIQLDINDGKVIGGDVFVSRKQNNYVKVVSQKISYNVTYKYYTKTDSGYIYDDTADIQKTVLFGDPVPYPTEEGEKPGDETTIADAAHTLKGWFSNVSVTGQGAITGFTGITNVSELVMGASDLVFHAFWEKNPNVEIVPNPGISKWYIERELDENENPIPATLSVAETAEFVAVFQEHIVGRTTIEVTPENNDIYTDGSIKIVLTDAQKDVWVAGTPIYIYEVRNSENTLWIYDDTVYTLEYTGYDNGEYQYHWNYANGDPGADGLFFENVEAPYLVRYNLNGGMLEGAASRAPKVVSFDEGELVPSEAPVKSGYTFTGWTYNTSSVDEFSTYDALVNNDKTVKEITLVAQYSYNGGGGGGGVSRYTLYYESNGGTVFDNERYTSGTTVQLDKKPVKDGFVFDGWHLDKACMEDATEVRMTQNRTVYAAWLEDDGSGKQSMLNRRDHFAYVGGYPDGTVRPNASITRAEVTAIFFRLLNEDARNENITHTNLFEDIQPEAWYNTAISTMANLGIVKGRNGKLFSANDFITRAEFAAICARFDDSEFTVVDNFTDVEGHWAEDEIHEAAAHGWITGYANNIFKPDQNITRAEAMTMINRVLNRTPESSDDLLDNMTKWPDNSDINAWYYLAVQEATNSHDYQMKDEKYEKWLAINPKINWEAYQ